MAVAARAATLLPTVGPAHEPVGGCMWEHWQAVPTPELGPVCLCLAAAADSVRQRSCQCMSPHVTFMSV
jgi:hypothetical protein